ncbi:thiamine monophosphate kinase [Buchnera aphidicola (Aphis glycines)]|uniref:Thiamine-monophosphate kinase n=1 Tax=Buchnera aphidicola (Aphis glycines) TaxID=1265350 RepID=A0A0M4HB79_9GAMM|nr:thiamine-phosphate kinase [Buchnera aphidicola]ALD15387.1 thiamine monophosphate kinase [Buchnera aphidicola (Aphis glycines)]
MKYNEFEIISNFFNKFQKKEKNLIKGIGDDCALVKMPKNSILAISTDTLVEGTHFFKNIDPKHLAYKTIAVNLSDLAAMGALPKWVILSITMPKLNFQWLKRFSDNFFKVLNQYQVTLIGGDTNRGSLSITLSTYGLIKGKKTLLREHAKEGDLIYITGSLGESAAGFFLLQKKNYIINIKTRNFLIHKHLHPTPRVAEGITIKNFANSAIDISDGLISDLGHILESSQCGANIELNQLPISKKLINNFTQNNCFNWALHFGEDYELCFTVAKKNIKQLKLAIKKSLIKCKHIGYITTKQKGFNLTKNNKKIDFKKIGFNHFN